MPSVYVNTNESESENEATIYECVDCNAEIEESNEITLANGETICQSCRDDNFFSCESCGEIESLEDSRESPSGEYYCEHCADDLLSYCDECSCTVYTDDIYYSENNDRYYCSDCYSEHDSEDYSELYENAPRRIQVSHDATTNFKELNITRLVGIEAECVFGDMPEDEDGTPIALNNKPPGWSEAYDGSIENNGREMISMPTNGDRLKNRILNLEKWARDFGVGVNRSCGLHTHFDATDMDWRDLQAIAIVTHKVEKYLFSMMPPSRMGSSWCKSMGMDIKDVINCTTPEEFVELWYDGYGANRRKYNDSRYHGLNLHAYFYLGTIEFRYHSGTLNYKKISNWVKICNSIIETGLEMSRNESILSKQLRNFYIDTVNRGFHLTGIDNISENLIGFNENTKRYMTQRIQTFNNRNIDVHNGYVI